ncbi:phospholipase D, Pi-PXTM-PLD [Thraustotheca clavata]|uniref:phospholipase D n=1 Tax=Thraustotheca clavata TaxID=74557 RepID=A0A1W0A5U8_9STRA|nr:phospholipase D, Pi-PXTM-PLD [Thraustotheca clavata]
MAEVGGPRSMSNESEPMTPPLYEASAVEYQLDLELGTPNTPPPPRDHAESNESNTKTELSVDTPEDDNLEIIFHIESTRIVKKQLIPSCLFRAAVHVGRRASWHIHFSQKDLVRLHLLMTLYLLWKKRTYVHLPWTVLMEKRATKRALDKELVEEYIQKLLAIPEAVECEILLGFLEISPLRIEGNPRWKSIKEGYVHMKINGADQIPFQKFCSRRLEKIYRHSYRIFLRIFFVSCTLFIIWPVLIFLFVAFQNKDILNAIRDFVNSIFGNANMPLWFVLTMVLLLVIYAVGFIYKFFERRLGTVRRWAVLKPTGIAFYKSRSDNEASEVFLFDTRFKAVEGNYRQGTSWMANGLTVRNKGGYVEVDCGHYYTRLLSILAFSLAFLTVIAISQLGFNFQDIYYSASSEPSTNFNSTICGFAFTANKSYYERSISSDGNIYHVQLNLDANGTQIVSSRAFTIDEGLQGAKLGPQWLGNYESASRFVGIFKKYNKKTDILKNVDSMSLPQFPNTKFFGLQSTQVLGNDDEDLVSLTLSDTTCVMPVQLSNVTAGTIGLVVASLLVGSVIASTVGILCNYIVSYIGIWHAHVRRDVWLTLLRDLPMRPKNHRYLSFAPQRAQGFLKWHVDGENAYLAMMQAIQNAKSQILIAGWWVCPDLLLKRPQTINGTTIEGPGPCLKDILLQKAEDGVMIHVLIYREVRVAMDLGSFYAMKSLMRHRNIRVLRDPDFQVQFLGFWSHHEKIVCIDSTTAFVGGLDLAFGRFDTHEHVLSDPGGSVKECQRWPGKDYSNPIIKDFVRVDRPFEDLVDRESIPRMPWHDVHCSLQGEAALDVALHFIERWNFVCAKKDNALRTDWCVCFRMRRFKYLPKSIVPLDAPATVLKPTPLQPEYQPCSLQVLRSVSQWSAGVPTEASIHTAYCETIRAAQHYVYLENQFFISGLQGNSMVLNRIVQALVDRIALAVAHGQVFRVFVVMPLLPALEGNIQSKQSLTHLHAIMHWQYETIRTSLMGALKPITPFPHEYVMFFGLRTYGVMPNGRLVTEQIYIHSKVLIADDKTVVMGSANINDRSMNGDRDSEIAIVMEDTTFTLGRMNDEPYRQGTLATDLRMKLFREHLGQSATDNSLLDPTCTFTWNYIQRLANNNTRVFEDVFHCAPSNELRSFDAFDSTWTQLDAVYENQRLNPLKGRHAWDALNLKDDDYAQWTDVNGVPIPIEKIQRIDYKVVTTDPCLPMLSNDDEGWYYARNFKIFQDMRLVPAHSVRRRDKFQHFMADRLLAQVRRRKYVRRSLDIDDENAIPVLTHSITSLNEDDETNFYGKWRQWAKQHIMRRRSTADDCALNTRATEVASLDHPAGTRHSDSEVPWAEITSQPKKGILRRSETDFVRKASSMFMPIFHRHESSEDEFESRPARSWLPPFLYPSDSTDEDNQHAALLLQSPSLSMQSEQTETQIGTVQTNASVPVAEENTARSQLSNIKGHLVIFPLEFLLNLSIPIVIIKNDESLTTKWDARYSHSVPHDASYYGKCIIGGILPCGLTHTLMTSLDVVKCNKQVFPTKNNGLVKGFKCTWYSAQGFFKYGFYEIFKDYFSTLAGEENAYKYRGFIFLAGSASVEFIADVALCPMEMVKVKVQTSPAGPFPTEFKPELVAMKANAVETRYPFGSVFYFFEKVVEIFYTRVLTAPKESYSKGTQLGITFTSGYLAGIICAIVSHPADSMSWTNASDAGMTNLATKGLGARIIINGTLTGLQWWIYDAFKTAFGMTTTGGAAK